MGKDYSQIMATTSLANVNLASETLHILMQSNPELIRQMVLAPATPEATGKALAAVYFSFLEAVTTSKVD